MTFGKRAAARRAVLLLVLALAHACVGEEDEGKASPAAGAGGAGGGAAGQAATGEGASEALGGSGASGMAGGLGGVTSAGTAGTSSQGEAGPGGRQAVGGEGGTAGDATSGGGAPPEPEPPLNGCLQFVDATAPAEPRVIAWDYGVGFEPERCLTIRAGQSVTWTGPLAAHPLQPAGGTTPSPILADYAPEATEHSVTFPAAGLFGYVCGQHSGMQGAIQVVD